MIRIRQMIVLSGAGVSAFAAIAAFVLINDDVPPSRPPADSGNRSEVRGAPPLAAPNPPHSSPLITVAGDRAQGAFGTDALVTRTEVRIGVPEISREAIPAERYASTRRADFTAPPSAGFGGGSEGAEIETTRLPIAGNTTARPRPGTEQVRQAKTLSSSPMSLPAPVKLNERPDRDTAIAETKSGTREQTPREPATHAKAWETSLSAARRRARPSPAWPRGNFTLEEELERAQYGWQSLADRIFAENSAPATP